MRILKGAAIPLLTEMALNLNQSKMKIAAPLFWLLYFLVGTKNYQLL